MGEAPMNRVTKAIINANSLAYNVESGRNNDITRGFLSEYEGNMKEVMNVIEIVVCVIVHISLPRL